MASPPVTGEPTPPEDGNPDQSARGHIVSASWSGPLPPPSQLAEFDRIVEGGAERIFRQFEKEADHRREMEKRDAGFVSRDNLIGQVLAGLFAAGILAVIWHAVDTGAYWVAGVVGTTTIVGGIVAFLGRRAGGGPSSED